MANQIKGKISQIIGPVIDVVFNNVEAIPSIYDALAITKGNGEKVILEVEQHIGDDIVRCIGLSNTNGLVRGMRALDTGAGIKVPVGKPILGRILNVIGEPVDKMGPIETNDYLPIHRESPKLES